MNKRQRGFLTYAMNSESGDYVRLAYTLALSLRASETPYPYLTVVVDDPDNVPTEYKKVFDNVIQNPWGDDDWDREWKLRNEWKVPHITLYEETFKVEADMLMFSDMSDIFDYVAKNQELAICNNVRTYQNVEADMHFYRRTFETNGLYNAFNGLTFFKTTQTTWDFFELIHQMAKNWEDYSWEYLRKYRQEIFTTDVAYGLAVKLMGGEEFFKPCIEGFDFVHMKMLAQKIPEPNKFYDDDWDLWLDNRMTKDCELFVNNYYISGLFHYHVKDWLTDGIIGIYENKVGI